MLYVVCCLFWLYFHRYLLKAEATLDNEIVHVDSESTTLGPQLIFVSIFLETAPILAPNAYSGFGL